MIKGRRIGIFGLGRSGLAVVRACLRLGATPILFEQSQENEIRNQDALNEFKKLGVEAHFGWAEPFEGIDLLVSNPAVDMRHPLLRAAQEKGIEIWSEIEFAYRISKAPIVAITGTNGKSTTTVMTYLCLRAAAVDAVLCGNIYGSGYDEIPLTEAALESTPDQVLVAEISSFQLEWVHEFKPLAAAITNITPDHLNRYDSFEQYAETKRRLFSNLGGSSQGDLTQSEVKPSDEGIVLTPHAIEAFGYTLPYSELPFEGTHNYENARVALLLVSNVLNPPSTASGGGPVNEVNWGGDSPDHKFKLAIEALKKFRGLDHRMEVVGEKNGVKVINNSMCTNPDALLKSSQSLSRRQHLLVGGVTKDLDFLPLKDHFASGSNAVYLFGADVQKIQERLESDFPIYTTMEEAFNAAIQKSKSGEVVMLAPGCASNDQFHDFRERGNVFKQMAREWLQEGEG